MTAPYDRVYTDDAVGQNRDRVKKLENAFTGGGGIDFNKTNFEDASGTNAGYLYLKLIGGPVLTISGIDYSYLLEADQDGSIQTILNGDGSINFINTGQGVDTGNAALEMEYGGKATTGGAMLIGLADLNVGNGANLLRNTEGITVIDNNGDGVYVTSTGQDVNFVAIKLDINGGDFLIQDEQVVTRDGSGVVTAIVPGDSLLRITNEGGGVWSYHIKTGATWVADL